jgi:hypothetical protein
MFGHRKGNPGDIHFLESVAADHRLGDLTGDRHDRHRVEKRIGECGDEIRRSRARSRDAYADSSSGACVPDRRQRRPLLETGQHMLERRPGNRIV